MNTLDDTDIETISAFHFVFIDSVSALQVARGYAISHQNSSYIYL